MTRRAPPLPEALVWQLEPGLHADGHGLYLRVVDSLSRSWVLIYFWQGRRREMGLGGAKVVCIDTARLRAAHARSLVAAGIDPIGLRRRTSSQEHRFRPEPMRQQAA